jgi:hypothetical protein
MDGLTMDVRMSDAASRIAALTIADLTTAVFKGEIAAITAASTDVVATMTPMATASTADAGSGLEPADHALGSNGSRTQSPHK